MSYHTFAITINLSDRPLPDELQQKIIQYVKKTSTYHCIAQEKEATPQEHWHLAVCLPKLTKLDNYKKWYISNIGKHLTELEVAAKKYLKITPWYSHGWVNNPQHGECLGEAEFHGMGYLNKEEKPMISENLPDDMDDLLEFYPAKNDSQLRRNTNAIWYMNAMKLWEERDEVKFPNTGVLKQFVTRTMLDRQMEVISDTKIFNQKVEWLRRFIEDDDTHPDPECYGTCHACKKRKHLSEFVN